MKDLHNYILEKLDNNINKKIKANNIEVVNKNDITSFEKDIVDIYINEITLYGMANGIIEKINIINNYINKIMIILGILTIIMFVLLFVIKKYKYLGSIIIANGLIIIFLYIAIYENIDSENLLIITENFSIILVNIIKNIGSLLLKMSIVSIVVGFVTSLTLSCKGKKK